MNVWPICEATLSYHTFSLIPYTCITYITGWLKNNKWPQKPKIKRVTPLILARTYDQKPETFFAFVSFLQHFAMWHKRNCSLDSCLKWMMYVFDQCPQYQGAYILSDLSEHRLLTSCRCLCPVAMTSALNDWYWFVVGTVGHDSSCAFYWVVHRRSVKCFLICVYSHGLELKKKKYEVGHVSLI